MNESPSLDAQKGAETAEERTLRIAAEEAELEQMLVQHGVSGDAADLLIEQLARKHKAEAELNAVFASLEDFDDYERHTSFTPSQRGEEVISPQNDSEGSDDDLAQDSEATADTASADEVHETAPRPLSREERAALAAELNTINGKLKEMWSVIRRYEADRADRVKKPAFTEGDYNVAVDTHNRLHAKAPELARAIGGKERLSGAVKIPDIAALRTYEKKTAAATREEREAKKQALSPSEKSAYHTAFGRRKDFVKALTDSGVHKDIAFGLYEEFAARAVGLQEFSDALAAELEAGHNPSIVPGDAYYELLKWFGIKDGPWSEVTTQINEVLAQLNTVPPPVPPRPERIVPITRMPKKQSDAVVPALSGIYEVRDDGHVYNSADTSPDAPRLDTDELLPSASDLEEKDGVLSGAAKANPARVLTASRGAVAYDRDFDDELALEKKTLSSLMKNKDVVHQPIAVVEANAESDPRLLGLYNIEHGVVRTGLMEGEGQVIIAEDAAQTADTQPGTEKIIVEELTLEEEARMNEVLRALREKSGQGEEDVTDVLAKGDTWKFSDIEAALKKIEKKVGDEFEHNNYSKESIINALQKHKLTACRVLLERGEMLNLASSEYGEVARAMFAVGGSFEFAQLLDKLSGEGIFDKDIALEVMVHGDSFYVVRNIKKFNLEGLDPETRARLEGTWKPKEVTVGQKEEIVSESAVGLEAFGHSPEIEAPHGFPEMPPNDPVNPEVGGQWNIEKTPINHGVAKQFAERFGMHKADLEKIPGFSELSSGQQLLTLERMKKVALEDINTEKVKRYRARINELSQPSNEAITLSVAGIPLVDKLPTDFWNKMKVMGMRATKQFQIGRMKDEVSAEWLNASDSDAATMKQSALEGAVAQVLAAKEFDVVEKEGKLETEYISEKDFGENLDEATKTKIQNFNGIANTLTGKGFAGTDEELKQQYELGAREMTQLLAAQTEGRFGGEKAAVWRTKLEGAVQMARFFEDNPDLDKELDTAGKNIGAAISFKNLLTERGAIAGISMGARWLGVSVLGLAAIPAVAAGVGGFMGWRRAKQELSENDLLAQMGERDQSDDAAQTEGGTNEKDRAKNVVSAERLTAKLEKLIGAYEQASDTETVQSPARDEAGHLRFRDTPDAEGKNIDMETVSRKEALRRELEARVAYTTRKMEEQLVDLGASRGERAERISQFALTLGKAQAQLGFADRGSNAFAARMNDILDIREEKIEANRKVHLVKQAAKGAAFGVGFSTAGMLVGSMLPSSAKAGSFGSGAVRAPEAHGEIMPPVSGSTEEAIAMAKRDGWVSDTVREMQEDAALNKAYVDKTMSLTSRSTDVGISDAELNALQATDNNPARAAAHAALLKAMELSNGRLSGDEVARIMVEHRIPSAIEEVNAGVVAENAPHHGGEDVETIIHEAKSGDNLTKLMKGKLQIMSELTPAQQENVIQNFIHSVSPEELRSIGLTNVHKIAVGDKIDIGKLNEVLLAKRINGEDLFARARGLGGALHAPSAGVEATPASTGLMSRETIGTLPATEASLIEQYVGRPISGSESNVLHSVKLLRTIAENSEEQRLADAAFNHLQLAMREANRPLLLGEMKRILMGHGGMDARIQFPEVPPPYKSVEVPTTQGEVPLESEPVEVAAPHMEATPPFEAARSASTPAFTPEAIANWNSYTEMQKLPLARVAAGVYLKADTNRMFGIDVFGNPSKDWTGISALQAQFIFGPDSTMPATPDSPVEKILEYANTQGFTSEHGYVPMKGETVEQFLRRAQTMKILEDGPRGKQ